MPRSSMRPMRSFTVTTLVPTCSAMRAAFRASGCLGRVSYGRMPMARMICTSSASTRVATPPVRKTLLATHLLLDRARQHVVHGHVPFPPERCDGLDEVALQGVATRVVLQCLEGLDGGAVLGAEEAPEVAHGG